MEAQPPLEDGRTQEKASKRSSAQELPEVRYSWSYLEVASCLDTLGNANQPRAETFDDQRAASFRQQALALREKVLGKDHPDVTASPDSLAFLEEGRMRKEAFKFSEVDSFSERALKLRELMQEWTPLELASCLHLIGDAHRQRWHALDPKYTRVEPLLQRALILREAVLGKHHPDVATSLHTLALFYAGLDQYEQARLLHERALSIREEALGKHHPDVATSLHSLGDLFAAQEHFIQAESLYERALAIREEALGKHHPDVATSLLSLADLYSSRGHDARAEPLLQRALAIREEALGRNHPDVATALHSLADRYSSRGRYARAESLHRRALAIREEALGKHSPGVASSLESLAFFYAKRGLHARAEPLHERALAIREEPIFKDHPGIVTSLHTLARVRLAQKNLDGALPLIQRALTLSEQQWSEFGLSAARLSNRVSHFHEEEEYLYTLVLGYPDTSRVRDLALSAVFFRKGRAVEAVGEFSRSFLHSRGNPASREDFGRLRSLRTQHAMLALAGPGPGSAAAHQRRLEELTGQIAALEASFHGDRRQTDLGPFAAIASLPPFDPVDPVGSVAAVIPKDGALIEFIAYRHRPLVPKPGAAASREPGALRYLALLLFADRSTHAVDLGPAEPIDRAALLFNVVLADHSGSYQPAAQALYNLVFRPLAPLLGRQVKRLFLSPDGRLALIPFAALHDGHRFLIDSWNMAYLLSGRDLIPRGSLYTYKDPPMYGLQDPYALSNPHSVVVLADPDFSATPATPEQTSRASPSLAEHTDALERVFSALRSELADQNWAPLPGTRREAEAIRRLFPEAQVLMGSAATKDMLLGLKTPAILHIATHGFFLEDVSPLRDSRAVGYFGTLGDEGPRQPLADPLLRSGLVLAGAHAPATPPGSSAPLVTALELAGLDLWGTQLVVLSACSTGRGDVKLGQGVQGLRSALMMAGTETLVTSLWQVDDSATQELMGLYYRHLQAGQGRIAALREAMQALRREHPHPHFWAPFIAIGQDTPLRGWRSPP